MKLRIFFIIMAIIKSKLLIDLKFIIIIVI